MSKEIVDVKFCKETIEFKSGIEKSFLFLAERLRRIKQEGLWKGGWTNWEEFVMEMKMSAATASKLITIYEKFVLEYNIDEDKLANAGWVGLYEVLPLCGTKKEALEAINDVTTLKRDDLREKIRELKNGECRHDWYEIHLKQCSVCGKREKIME